MRDNLMLGKKKIAVDRVTELKKLTETVQTTVTFPEPVLAIKDRESKVMNYTANTKKNSITINGILFHHMYYVDENQLVRRSGEEAEFQLTIRVPGVAPGMKVMTTLQVKEKGIEELEGGMAASISTMIYVNLTVLATDEVEVAVDIMDEDNKVTVEKEALQVENLFHESNYTRTLNPRISLPEKASKICRVNADAGKPVVESHKNNLLVRGPVIQHFYYRLEDGSLRGHQEHFTYEVSIKIPGLQSWHRYNVIPEIIVYHYQIDQIDQEDVSIIDQEIKLLLKVTVKETLDLDVLTRVNGPGIRVKHRSLEGLKKVGETDLSEVLTPRVELEEATEELFQIDPFFYFKEPEIYQEQVGLDGEIYLKIIYRGEDYLHLQQEVLPTRLNGHLPGIKSFCRTEITETAVEDISCQLEEYDILEVSITPRVTVEIIESFQKKVVEEIWEVSIPEGEHTRIYFVHPQDTLEKISWRFKMPLERLLEVNPEVDPEQELNPGMKIRIPAM